MKITAIEFSGWTRLREVKIITYIAPNDYAEVAALRGKLKNVVRKVPLNTLQWWHVDDR